MKQVVNFTGLRFPNNISPTDIDGGFEINDKIFVFFEFKLQGVGLPNGQRLFLRRVVDCILETGRNAILFVCEHTVSDKKQQIMAKDTRVTEVYLNGTFSKIDHGKTLKDSIDFYLDACGVS